jgi:hypothetical protein
VERAAFYRITNMKEWMAIFELKGKTEEKRYERWKRFFVWGRGGEEKGWRGGWERDRGWERAPDRHSLFPDGVNR